MLAAGFASSGKGRYEPAGFCQLVAVELTMLTEKGSVCRLFPHLACSVNIGRGGQAVSAWRGDIVK